MVVADSRATAAARIESEVRLSILVFRVGVLLFWAWLIRFFGFLGGVWLGRFQTLFMVAGLA
jgi:hypothetical protein